jgi:hypothetical protein
MSKHVCLYGILLLFAVSLFLQYFRIKMRKQIIDMTEQFVPGNEFEGDWRKAGEGPGAVFRDFRRMRLVKNFVRLLPSHILTRLQTYKVLCTIELTTTISTLLVAVFAYKICI